MCEISNKNALFLRARGCPAEDIWIIWALRVVPSNSCRSEPWSSGRNIQRCVRIEGATQYNEPGVLMNFEETSEEMTKNVASLGFDLKGLAARKKVVLEYVRIEPAEIQETGEYDLEGLFIRLEHAVDTIGAKRVVLDTIEAIFSGFSNTGMLRAEIPRLFRWLKDRGLTTVVTAEKGDGTLT